MPEEIKYQINVLMADNTVTKDDLTDKIFVVVSTGTADKERIISEMMEVNPGLERETLRHVLDLENRVIKKLLLTGMRVNNGLFEATAQCRGVVQGTAWNPETNTIYVNFQQGKDMREAINSTTVNVIGEKGASMYLSTGEDAATRSVGFTATAGSNFTLTGKNIKIAGDDPSVGITLTDSDGTETKITGGMIGLNQPSKLIFFIPAGLADGEYTLTVTTQFGGGPLLKSPRSVSRTLYIGEAPEPAPGGGEEEEGGGESPDPIV